ncbi:Delta(12)-fatty-acid desaturase [Rhizophlyctis rosea]|nr:Delta(12)-fatty-acid desaturase [Rhizophlyctis rosea]
MAPPEGTLRHRDTTTSSPSSDIPPLKSFPAKSRTKNVVASAKYAEQWEKPAFTLKQVRESIPAHCFKRDNLTSFSYVLHDVTLMSVLLYAATRIGELPVWAQFIAWPLYWWCQGVVCTGIWVIAHECGHQGFSEKAWINNSVGYVLHSFLLVPYFSWKHTHSAHHKANAHMTKDQVFVPHLRSEFPIGPRTAPIDHHHDEPAINAAPLMDILYITRMLTLGWPAYLLMNVSGQKFPVWTSHFRPDAPIFTPRQWFSVVLSDIGFGIMVAALAAAGYTFGSLAVIKYYVIPYFFVNMWLVLITYLQHTDARIPHFRDSEWNFLLGALSTVDRDYGILNHFFHHIGDTHVAHHLFSTMPHYHAQEATEYIKKAVGKYYIRDERWIWSALWKSYKECRFVEDEGDVLWYKH